MATARNKFVDGAGSKFTIPSPANFCHNWLCTPMRFNPALPGKAWGGASEPLRAGGICRRALPNLKKRRGANVGKVHLCDWWRGVVFRQRTGGGLDRLSAGEPWTEGQPAEVRSVSECRSWDHVAVPAWRSLRHR